MNDLEEMPLVEVEYEITAERRNYEDYGDVVVYGIRGRMTDEEREIPAVSPNYHFVKRLWKALMQHQVSLIHMADVIADALYERELAFD